MMMMLISVVYCDRPSTPIGDIVEHKYQKCWVQQNVYNLLDRKQEQIASVSVDFFYSSEN